jgi:hypothetical protein
VSAARSTKSGRAYACFRQGGEVHDLDDVDARVDEQQAVGREQGVTDFRLYLFVGCARASPQLREGSERGRGSPENAKGR